MLHNDIINRRGKTIPTRSPFSEQVRKSIYMLMFTLLAIIVMVSIVYLLNSSQSTQKGYSIKQQQLEKDLLIEKSNELIRQLIQAQSFHSIENSALVKKMIKPEKPVYIDLSKK